MARTRTDAPTDGSLRDLVDELPLDRLKDEAKHGLTSLGEWAVQSAGNRIGKATDKLDDIAAGGPIGAGALAGAARNGLPGAVKGALGGVKDKVTGAFSRGSTSGTNGGEATRSTNIVEEIDIGAPVRVVYDQWTQFQDFAGFMKKVEEVEQTSDEKLDFKAQVFWSHRTWSATIIEQVPDELIVWRSSGEKGHVDGAVTFHELAPRLTRVVVVLEYYPKGLLERTANLWRAQGRRARLELKHFRRHVMVHLLQDPDQVEGWRGEIHDSEVEETDDEAREREASEDDEYEEYDEEPVDEEPLDEEDEVVEEDEEDEPVDEEPEDEPVDEEPVEEEPAPRRRRRRTSR